MIGLSRPPGRWDTLVMSALRTQCPNRAHTACQAGAQNDAARDHAVMAWGRRSASHHSGWSARHHSATHGVSSRSLKLWTNSACAASALGGVARSAPSRMPPRSATMAQRRRAQLLLTHDGSESKPARPNPQLRPALHGADRPHTADDGGRGLDRPARAWPPSDGGLPRAC